MPRLPSSLSDVSTTIEPLEEGTYQGNIESVDVGKSKSKLDMVTVVYNVQSDKGKRQIYDYMVLETKAHEPNEPGLRQLKRLIVAALGEERADAEDFDTDELVGAQVTLVIKQDSYDDQDTGDTIVNNKIKKVLPA